MAETEAPAQPEQSAQKNGSRIIGASVSKVFDAFAGNFFRFSAVIIVVTAFEGMVLTLFNRALPQDVFESVQTDAAVWTAVQIVSGSVSFAFLSAALCYGVYVHFCGGKAPVRQMLAHGLKRLLPLTGAFAVVSVIATGCLWLFGAVLNPIFDALFESQNVDGFMLFGIPLFVAVLALFEFMMTVFVFFIPAAVIRRGGVFASFGQSLRLTKGLRWQVFGAFCIMQGLILLLSMPLTLLAALLSLLEMYLGPLMNAHISSAFAVNFLYCVFIVFVTAVYHELRAAKEGAGANSLDAVAD